MGLVSATVDEIGAELFVAIPEEYVVTTPLIDAEIFVEVIRHGVQGDSFTTHPCLETLDCPSVELARRRRTCCHERSDAQEWPT